MSSDQAHGQELLSTWHALKSYSGYPTSHGEEQGRWVEALLTSFIERSEALTNMLLSVETKMRRNIPTVD